MKKVDLSTYNNDWFKTEIGAGKIKQTIWYFINVLFFINPLVPFSRLKIFVLKCFGAQLGSGITIKPGVNIKYPWKLSIDSNTWIGEKVWIDNLATVKIGKNVCLSQGAMLLTGNHNYKKISFDLRVQPIVIEDGVWLGAQSVVCPGVTLYSHSVLSVSSVANRDLDPFCIYTGNPAVRVRGRTIE